ncbi:riboflavin biosynthesis protein RibD [Moraxella macacae 0408225]|uniref:Riboflavin biosynthesis protein RibD n=1 Tax=Moraxella macacae 0408225 TaxID=1230338 RepID=L2F874_9GAMM|nr:bifunctional diaminohydroxyphosphoribosylaminopyrimidine deaminase/5-amino-6-(5-phosphoribosylamino)uracil reductase RibD [Moraxella macacae]ELA09242.1 riboflavin biosynthesis protein RibD [Moraxella macacae 0408225]
MINSQDSYFMSIAINLAKKGQFTTRPNPCVGCVIVKDNQVIGQGYHYKAGQPHAEVFALRQAIQKIGDDLMGATAYVTLEPCSHYGRTPPCADALIKAGVSRVVIATSDPNPKVLGAGIAKLQHAGINVTTNVCQDDAKNLNQGFLKTMAGGLPYVRLKIACSLDGKIAMTNGESKWITGDKARDDVQKLRAVSGAIITGSETIIQDVPRLDVRSHKIANLADIDQPLLVVLDRRKRLNLTATSLKYQQNRPFWLCQDELSLAQVLTKLKTDHQIHDVLVEAGASVATAFLKAGLVDEFIVYQAPCLLGNSAKPMFVADFYSISEQLRFKMVSHETLGDDLKLTFKPL